MYISFSQFLLIFLVLILFFGDFKKLSEFLKEKIKEFQKN